MARRVSMPSADDLFRPTGDETDPAAGKPQGPAISSGAAKKKTAPAVRAVPDAPEEQVGKGASGRIRHDEKMTVYVTVDELVAIEQARLSLRARHRLAVDRGRLVREAISLVLADLEEHGEESLLVRRLIEE